MNNKSYEGKIHIEFLIILYILI